MELLAFSKANRQKGKAAIITKADGEVIIKKAQPKQKIKYLYYFKTLAELIKALNSKKRARRRYLFCLILIYYGLVGKWNKSPRVIPNIF